MKSDRFFSQRGLARRSSALFLIVCLLMTGCTVRPGAAASHADTVSTPQVSSSSDIILDGPWASTPDTPDSDTAWDEDSGALTLPSDPARMAFVALPDTDKDAFTNNIYTLANHNGRVYPGYGDLYNNQGPLNILSYDPLTGSQSVELRDVPEDRLGGWLEGEDGAFYLTGDDARESWSFGNFYVNNGMEWRKVRTIYRGLHVNKLAEFKGRLYAAFSSDDQKIVAYPYILVSDDGGASWQYEKLEDTASQDCTVSQITVVHAPGGDQLYAIATVVLSSAETRQSLYRFDGNTWEQVDLGESSADFILRDCAAYQGSLLLTAYTNDTEGLGWAIITATWDGKTLSEIPFLRGRNLDLTPFTEHDGWLYAVLPAARADPYQSVYELVRSSNLTDWQTVGSLDLPQGVLPGAIAFAHSRLYLGGQVAGREIDKDPTIYALTQLQTQPLKNASLTWDADVPDGASLYFQVRTGRDFNAFNSAEFVGPDGTSSSLYTTAGQSLPASQAGATVVAVKIWKNANAAGEGPFVRTVTITGDDGQTVYAVDAGSGLYTAANVKENAQFTSQIFEFAHPISNGSLFFSAQTPAGTSLSFQVRAGKTVKELESADFSGPDGSKDSFYNENNMPLWSGLAGSSFIQYQAYLSSSDPAVAPFLMQVGVANDASLLDQLQVRLDFTSAPTAGEAAPVRISLLNKEDQELPVNGKVALSAADGTELLPVSPNFIQLAAGTGQAGLTFTQARPTRLCLEFAGREICAESITVVAGEAAYFSLSAPDLESTGALISPHAAPGQPFSLTVTARDRFGNLAGDYTGMVSCAAWKWQALDQPVIPAYTFSAADKGSHNFLKAAGFSSAGEYSLVCRDEAQPAIAGALAVMVGSFRWDLFP